MAESRIKRTRVHKPFFHVKKTNKHPDEPLTIENKAFVQDMIRQIYATDPLQSYVRPSTEVVEEENDSPLKPELRPWPRGQWSELGASTRRTGLLARKIGVVPMWFNNGKRVATTMLQVSSSSANNDHAINSASSRLKTITSFGSFLQRTLPRRWLPKEGPCHESQRGKRPLTRPVL